MISKTKIAACAAFAAALMASSAAFAQCEGVSTQATDCILYYGPVAQSPYKGTVPAPGQTSAWQTTQGAWRAAPASQ